VSEGSSLHLYAPENAVNRPTASVLLEQGTPTITAEIEGVQQDLILDTGSNISLLQPGVSRSYSAVMNATAPPTVHKDLSLISLVPKWSGSESAISLEEFFSSIEGSARIGHWAEADCLQVAILKLVKNARTFYNSCPELHGENVTWQSFQNIFRKRFKDIRTDQFHYMQLQTARQRRNEGPQEFADRCRTLAQKLVCKVDDPQVLRVHQENAERMLLAAFVSGLIGVPGKQCRFSNPQNIQQALSIALTVDQAEKQERFNESFYTKYDKTVGLLSRSPGHKTRGEENSSRSENTHSNKPNYRASRSSGNSSRSAQTESALRCYECQGIGHFGRECPTRLRRESQNAPGKKNPSGRSRRSDSPGDGLNGEGLRKTAIRETSKRCERRQLSTPLKTLSIDLRPPFYWSRAHPLSRRK